ncbi:MAG: HesA/MoeB/ThiF family protein [Candidatus Rokuibacteriota bacterium]
MTARLTDEQVRRYSRQMILPEVGGAGQACLREARILVVGAGGLGSPAALYLAGAGVGTLGLVDSDTVDLSNLGRQILFDTKDIDRPKAFSGQARLEALNPGVRAVPHPMRLGPENVGAIVAGYDVVLEGSDNMPTKLLVNDACVAGGKLLVVASAVGWDGQLLAVRPRSTACYRCVYRSAPPVGTVPSCEAAGILGPVAGVVGSLQAVEALKLCLGLPSTTAGHLLLYDGATGETRAVAVRPDPRCLACGTP